MEEFLIEEAKSDCGDDGDVSSTGAVCDSSDHPDKASIVRRHTNR